MTDAELNAMLAAHGVDTRSIRAWTYGYFPFTLGGRVWRPIVAKLDCDSPVHLGKGFYGCLLHGPDGTTKVAEATSGAIIGDTIEGVCADIEACQNIDLMKKQVADAQKELSDAENVEPDEFWRRILRAKESTQ